jgi:hypothetical protein
MEAGKAVMLSLLVYHEIEVHQPIKEIRTGETTSSISPKK